MHHPFYLLTTLILLSPWTWIPAQVPAFPGAEGYGKYTTGGRGGTVYEVTNLNDSGPGSLRDAVSQSGRTVVFRVSGDIELLSELVIRGDNLTIAGQTAPGDGICVRDYPTKINGNNIIVRYLRFRLGDRYGLSSDALDINDQHDVIVDHCTMSWGVDECFSAYGNTNITVQWCIIGEGLNLKGHSMGGLWGGYTTYHHNLIHTSNTRHPKYAYTYDEDITDSRNNVIYNWGYNSAYTSPTGRVNLVNNYYKAGPATGAGVMDRIVQAEPTKRMYITGNYVAGFPDITEDNWNGGVDPLNGGLPVKYETPFPVPNPLPEQSARDAYQEIIDHVGASYPTRDDADNRAIKNLVDSTGSIIMRQGDVGGFPRLRTLPAPTDTDHDGMPDAYESGTGLNPEDPADRNGDQNGNGYTNLEDYINGLTGIPEGLPRPGFVEAEALAEDKVELRWYDLNSGEEGFIIERSTDSVVFQAVVTVAPGTTYYLDENVDPLTPYFYRISAFTLTDTSEWAYTARTSTFEAGARPGQALQVSPPDLQTEIPVTGTTLLWEKGDFTLKFNVWFGTDPGALSLVDSATTQTTHQTGALEFGTNYSWRVDAVNDNGTTEGTVWSFQTLEAVEPELVLYWPFLEEQGQVVYDSSGNHNDGTLQNGNELIREEGPFNRAINLGNSGPTGHIEVPDNLSISFDENPFSISFWMRASSVSDSSIYLFHKGSFAATEGTERNGKWFGLEMRGGSFRFSVDDNHTKSVVGSSTSSYVTGEWVHVVVIRDVYRGRLYLYRNNGLSAVVSDNTGGISQDMPLIIGNSDHMYPEYYGGNSDENAPYRGELAELVICRHPFSLQEIEQLYKYNRIPTLSPGVGWMEKSLASGLKAYPNPFEQSVCLEFENGAGNHVIMEIYDINGRLVRKQRMAVIPNSRNRIFWNGETDQGTEVNGRLFMLLLKDPGGTITGNILLIRDR
jgi:pectate lyase